MMRTLLPAVTLLALLSPANAADRGPNIIHVLADDVGYDDIGCFGAKDIATPHIDKLAKEGMKFTSFYAPHSTCTPTRAALLTGCYAQRVGLPQVLFPNSKVGLSDKEVTIAALLKKKGYATAVIGKWHLGHQAKFLPTKHGFDHFLGIPYPNDHVPERLDAKGKARGFPPMPLYKGEKVIQQPAQMAKFPELFTADAVRFIAEHKDKPFFLHFANVETHTPWLVTRPFLYKSKAGVFGDAVQCLDWSVGQITAALAKHGLEKNTLIVFTSDNGPLVHAYPELEGIYGHAAAVDTTRKHLLREGKYQSRYEGGTRVACVMRWPGKIAAGTKSDAVVAGFDLFTTFAKVAGAEVPKDRVIDGKDITPLMFGVKGAKSPHEAIYHYQGYNLVAVRAGRWKLNLGGPKPVKKARVELFDLDADIGETKNVADQHPDVVKKLHALLEKARDDLGDGLAKRPGKNRRKPGEAD